jgi:hypothetical protein
MRIPPEEMVVSYSSLGLYPLLSRGATCVLLTSPRFWAKSWELPDLSYLILSSNECSERHRERVGTATLCLEGRKIGRQPNNHHLIEMHRLLEILETMFPKVTQAYPFCSVLHNQIAGCLGE